MSAPWLDPASLRTPRALRWAFQFLSADPGLLQYLKSGAGSHGQDHPVAGTALIHRRVRLGRLGQRPLLDPRANARQDGEVHRLLDVAGRAGRVTDNRVAG